MSNIQMQHEQEAAGLALEKHKLEKRLTYIDKRLDEISVIQQTADFCDKENQKALEHAANIALQEKVAAILATANEYELAGKKSSVEE